MNFDDIFGALIVIILYAFLLGMLSGCATIFCKPFQPYAECACVGTEC